MFVSKLALFSCAVFGMTRFAECGQSCPEHGNELNGPNQNNKSKYKKMDTKR
jgi:hypothetical protein